MSSFPSIFRNKPLCENDFRRFSLLFSRILRNKIPTGSEIRFILRGSNQLQSPEEPYLKKAIEQTLLQAEQNPDAVSVHNDGFLLPFSTIDGLVVAAVLGVDPFIVKKADLGWLIDVRNSALSEFAVLKHERIAWNTDLLNMDNLRDLLEILNDTDDFILMLVELYPKARSSKEAILYARKSALSLVNFSENRFWVHDLGHGLFALIAESKEFVPHFGALLLSWLRKDGFPRVHIGYSRKKSADVVCSAPQSLFDQAWNALQTARKRGPFSFCDFALLDHPEQHPLRRPSRSLVAKFSRRWRDSNRFALVQFQVDKALAGKVSSCLDSFVEDRGVDEKKDLYVFLDGMTLKKAQKWTKGKMLEMKIPKGEPFLVGIGVYPYADFSKTEILYNCRRAIRHAAFFGSGSVAVFDAVSLNISGDIFYGEGDLASAVREYRRGLVCDADNINLLNSLGVAYAMMEKHRLAHQCFSKVLAIDPDNFMALYNLGLGEKLLGMRESAVTRFERAMTVLPRDSEYMESINDLQFQMGNLYCLTQSFEKAVDVLLPWYRKAEGTKKAGYACRLLGKSYYGMKNNTEAMVWLQRALQFDGFDAEVMGILGEVYLDQGEGDEIALSLGEKSVELDPIDVRLKLRLAKSQKACGKYEAARATLRPCLKKRETKAEAQLLNGLIYRKEGRLQKATSWFTKVTNRDDTPVSIAEEARYYLEADRDE